MKSARNAGFTLIEITAVVIIIGMVASIAIVRLDGMLPSTRTESAARQLLAQLDFARTQSIAKAQEYDVVFDFDEQRYAIRIPFDEDGKIVRDREERDLLSWHYFEHGTYLRGLIDTRGELRTEGQYALTYNPLGTAREIYVYLSATMADESLGDYELTVRVLALTGIASVFQGHIEPQLLVENDF